MNDSINRQDAIKGADAIIARDTSGNNDVVKAMTAWKSYIEGLPPSQPEYEELTPEEAAAEIASGSIMSAWHFVDDMMRLTQMGYVICRKK